MLLSLDRKFVVLTPTKCGTFSLESCLLSDGLKRETLGWARFMPRHSEIVPLDWHCAHVFIVCRNPYARLVSMFTYGKKKQHSWILRISNNGRSFAAFVDNWLEARERGKPHDWVTLCSEYVASARSTNDRVSVLRLEDDGVAKVLQKVGCATQARHVNSSKLSELGVSWRQYWTRDTADNAKEALAPDMKLGCYEMPC